MKSSTNYKTIRIDIITRTTKRKLKELAMDQDKYKHHQNRYTCSVCLNKNSSKEHFKDSECCKRKSKSCPICQKNIQVENKNDDKDTISAKKIQTSEYNVTKDLCLLNEVLTVFQNKKQYEAKREKSRTTILKDASVNTEKLAPRLSCSKIFCYSLDETVKNNNRFTIINYQPETQTASVGLFKHKSSSIPQMKLDELKNSLKQKNTSKDAIEEVNRMFANVRKLDNPEENRPLVRNGPRVLPVVKTEKISTNTETLATSKCNCQNYKMSSGDSECCHHFKDEYVHRCCHYQHCSNVGYCGNCRKKIDK